MCLSDAVSENPDADGVCEDVFSGRESLGEAGTAAPHVVDVLRS